MTQVRYHQFTKYASVIRSLISYFLPLATFQFFMYIYTKNPYSGV